LLIIPRNFPNDEFLLILSNHYKQAWFSGEIDSF
jgi:hypothetical protein